MSPAIYGLVMATGIVSLAADQLGLPQVARALFALNIGQYALLWGLTLLRALTAPRRLLADLADHARAPGFFTMVAATGILGSQALLQAGNRPAATGLWGLTALLWLLLSYAIVTTLITSKRKPALDKGINGGWLLAVVATQSLAVLSILLAGGDGLTGSTPLGFLALALWLWGGMLYIWIAALIFYRYLFFPLTASDLTPPDWINMGAMAISTLAGTLLLTHGGQDPLLLTLRPFLVGFTIFYWAAGSWWIPILLLLGVWRHGLRRVPLVYDPLYWGLVFPLGMYALATWQLDRAIGLDRLAGLALGFFYAGLLAWGLTFAGLLRRVLGFCAPHSRSR